RVYADRRQGSRGQYVVAVRRPRGRSRGPEGAQRRARRGAESECDLRDRDLYLVSRQAKSPRGQGSVENADVAPDRRPRRARRLGVRVAGVDRGPGKTTARALAGK